MPKSKRAKVVHLTKTQKKGKELTLRLYANIRECISQYPYIYVFSVENMRNNYLKDVRSELATDSRYVLNPTALLPMSNRSSTSSYESSFSLKNQSRHIRWLMFPYRLFFGKTRVMAKALGDFPSTEPHPSTSLLSAHLTGPCGLIFSHRGPAPILSYFSTFHPNSYARAGIISTRSFTIPSGTLYTRAGEIPASEDVPLEHSIEPALRKLGVPTRLVKGRVELDEPFEVCKEGVVLGSGQTTLLKMFGVVMAEFAVEVRAWWVRDSGAVKVVNGDREEEHGGGGIDGNGIAEVEMGEEDEGFEGFEGG